MKVTISTMVREAMERLTAEQRVGVRNQLLQLGKTQDSVWNRRRVICSNPTGGLYLLHTYEGVDIFYTVDESGQHIHALYLQAPEPAPEAAMPEVAPELDPTTAAEATLLEPDETTKAGRPARHDFKQLDTSQVELDSGVDEEVTFLVANTSDPEEANDRVWAVIEKLAENLLRDRSLTFSQLRNANLDRCENGFKHELNSWSVSDWGVATAGEAGEMCNEIKKLRRHEDKLTAFGNNPRTRLEAVARIAIELGDMILYADLLAASLGLTLEAAVIRAFNAKSKECGLEHTLP